MSAFCLFHAPPATEFSTLSLHDALPIYLFTEGHRSRRRRGRRERDLALKPGDVEVEEPAVLDDAPGSRPVSRSEEHTSELQSPDHLVCRLLLEKKKPPTTDATISTPEPP